MFDALQRARTRLRASSPSELSDILGALVRDIQLEAAVRASEKNPNISRIRWENVEQTVERVGNVGKGTTAWAMLEDWVQLVALETSAAAKERGEDIRQKVTLSTMHSSKGLEFPIVFLCGASDDLLPHAKSIEEAHGAAEAEERRLLYVGITRAKERLFITWARIAHVRHERIRRQRTRFLDELPEGLWISRESDVPSDYEKKLDEKNSKKFEGLRALFGD
jgi:DNA helicase-2/ATP-dependent DNA helicase PcrA